METELPIDYDTLKKQLKEMTVEMEFWRSEAARLEEELDIERSISQDLTERLAESF